MTSSISVGFFSPSSLSGCVLWLDGSSLNLSNGATVSTWSSLGPVSYTTTSTAGRFPTYASNIQNGRGAVQYATGQTSILSNFVLSPAQSIFLLYYPINTSAGSPFIEQSPDTNTNDGFFLHAQNNANYAIRNGGTLTTVNIGTIAQANTWQLIEGLNKDPNANNTMAFYSNATLVASNGIQNGTTTITNTLFINGRNNTNTLSYPSYIAELIIYSNALNNFGRQQVEGYLAWKWGLSSLLPSTHPYKNAPFLTLTETVPRSIPSSAFLLPINTFSTIKTFTLPVVSTNPGRVLILKDYLGSANSNVIRLSTTGVDTIERSNVSSMTLSNAYGAWWFQNDGISKWFLTSAYLNSLTIVAPEVVLSVLPAVRYSFLSANYSGSGNVNNIGSNTGVGSATVSRNSYTSANPGFITNVRAGNYVYTPSVTFRTIIMIVRIRDTSSPSYLLDGRNGMANGWIYNDGYGSDWTGTTYYRDAVLTAFPTNLPTPLNDSQWRHVTLVAPANYTTQMTFANRFSFNEGFGGDISELMMFTQLLTLQQVKDNFNFFATRFGWTPVS